MEIWHIRECPRGRVAGRLAGQTRQRRSEPRSCPRWANFPPTLRATARRPLAGSSSLGAPGAWRGRQEPRSRLDWSTDEERASGFVIGRRALNSFDVAGVVDVERPVHDEGHIGILVGRGSVEHHGSGVPPYEAARGQVALLGAEGSGQHVQAFCALVSSRLVQVGVDLADGFVAFRHSAQAVPDGEVLAPDHYFPVTPAEDGLVNGDAEGRIDVWAQALAYGTCGIRRQMLPLEPPVLSGNLSSQMLFWYTTANFVPAAPPYVRVITGSHASKSTSSKTSPLARSPRSDYSKTSMWTPEVGTCTPTPASTTRPTPSTTG